MSVSRTQWHYSQHELDDLSILEHYRDPLPVKLIDHVAHAMSEHRRVRSNEKFPKGAGRCLAKDLPKIMLSIRIKVNSAMASRGPTSGELKKQKAELRQQCRHIRSAQASLVKALRVNPVNLTGESPEALGGAKALLAQLADHFDALVRRASRMAPRRTRQPGAVRQAVLVTMASWWYRQPGWPPPTQTKNGRFLSVCKLIEEHLTGEAPPDLNPKTVAASVAEGLRLCKLSKRTQPTKAITKSAS